MPYKPHKEEGEEDLYKIPQFRDNTGQRTENFRLLLAWIGVLFKKGFMLSFSEAC